ncbi:hypothetical protein [Cysteiniphilum sp. QT6929]|uniref:hypothetical protein n=1 Tax=Cysteiniphilum sp. QT6929 TaxID=2975055 RepID=UPI0024B39328|nr:hypothetical protein [Cysteiniphilum sp. QT6929]WHN66540.1 hypothetical protein NYP54_04740 [Cysteiniphilum sp. QT6929]
MRIKTIILSISAMLCGSANAITYMSELYSQGAIQQVTIGEIICNNSDKHLVGGVYDAPAYSCQKVSKSKFKTEGITLLNPISLNIWKHTHAYVFGKDYFLNGYFSSSNHKIADTTHINTVENTATHFWATLTYSNYTTQGFSSYTSIIPLIYVKDLSERSLPNCVAGSPCSSASIGATGQYLNMPVTGNVDLTQNQQHWQYIRDNLFTIEKLGADVENGKTANTLYRIHYHSHILYTHGYAIARFNYYLNGQAYSVYPLTGYTSSQYDTGNMYAGERNDLNSLSVTEFDNMVTDNYSAGIIMPNFDIYGTGSWGKVWYTPNDFSWTVSLPDSKDIRKELKIVTHFYNLSDEMLYAKKDVDKLEDWQVIWKPENSALMQSYALGMSAPEGEYVNQCTKIHWSDSDNMLSALCAVDLSLPNGDYKDHVQNIRWITTSSGDKKLIADGKYNEVDLYYTAECARDSLVHYREYWVGGDLLPRKLKSALYCDNGGENLQISYLQYNKCTPGSEVKAVDGQLQCAMPIKITGISLYGSSLTAYATGVNATGVLVQLRYRDAEGDERILSPQDYPQEYRKIVFYRGSEFVGSELRLKGLLSADIINDNFAVISSDNQPITMSNGKESIAPLYRAASDASLRAYLSADNTQNEYALFYLYAYGKLPMQEKLYAYYNNGLPVRMGANTMEIPVNVVDQEKLTVSPSYADSSSSYISIGSNHSNLIVNNYLAKNSNYGLIRLQDDSYAVSAIVASGQGALDKKGLAFTNYFNNSPLIYWHGAEFNDYYNFGYWKAQNELTSLDRNMRLAGLMIKLSVSADKVSSTVKRYPLFNEVGENNLISQGLLNNSIN